MIRHRFIFLQSHALSASDICFEFWMNFGIKRCVHMVDTFVQRAHFFLEHSLEEQGSSVLLMWRRGTRNQTTNLTITNPLNSNKKWLKYIVKYPFAYFYLDLIDFNRRKSFIWALMNVKFSFDPYCQTEATDFRLQVSSDLGDSWGW